MSLTFPGKPGKVDIYNKCITARVGGDHLFKTVSKLGETKTGAENKRIEDFILTCP